MYKSTLDNSHYNDYVFDHRDCNEKIGCIQDMNYYDYYVFLHCIPNSNNCLQDKSVVVNQYDINELKDSLSFLEDYLESIDKPPGYCLEDRLLKKPISMIMDVLMRIVQKF